MSKEIDLQTGTCLFSGKRIEILLKKEADSNKSLRIWKCIEKSRCIQKADAQDNERYTRLRRTILSIRGKSHARWQRHEQAALRCQSKD